MVQFLSLMFYIGNYVFQSFNIIFLSQCNDYLNGSFIWLKNSIFAYDFSIKNVDHFNSLMHKSGLRTMGELIVCLRIKLFKYV